jgi:hypothetical protein
MVHGGSNISQSRAAGRIYFNPRGEYFCRAVARRNYQDRCYGTCTVIVLFYSVMEWHSIEETLVELYPTTMPHLQILHAAR